ncbi:MAG: Deoxyuridine 5'-triphosphate nucleotidohydrolase Dut [Parcubacteria group bacterium GW2011_GWA2_31_28]|nr:MAG: Deoxyuridine 5'-triphosphate nucleotidohydrolase Dut [Parcubacteria group bacterium GW2011_GWA2_31_28]
MLKVKIKRIKDNAVIPSYAHAGDSGVDLYSAEDYLLKPNERILVSTGIKIAVPKGYEAQVRPKSIEKGKKIAQMVFNKVEEAEFEEVDELENTKRGAGGFGSTGH